MPQSLAVASLAGSLNVLATNPIWLAVTRMQTAAASRHGRTSFFREVQTLYDEGGIPALWRVQNSPLPRHLCLHAAPLSPRSARQLALTPCRRM